MVDDPIDMLRELFGCVDPVPEGELPPGPHLQVGVGEGSLFFSGQSLELLRTIERDYAEHWASGGWSAGSITDMVIEACRRAAEEGVEAGVKWFRRSVAAPPTIWTIYARAHEFIYNHNEGMADVIIGDARYTNSRPAVGGPAQVVLDDFPPPLWRVDVAARDEHSARFLAQQKIDESRAVLALGAGRISRPQLEAITVYGDSFGFALGNRGLLMADVLDGADPVLRRGFAELSAAARRLETNRTDWERRAVAAARWYLKAATATWYADALSAAMTALECLLVRGQREQAKGRLIGERATRIGTLRRIGADAQPGWLQELYKRRNDAVHEGLSVAEDLEVEELIDLTANVCLWGMRHLIDDHRPDSTPCYDFDDVYDAAAHPMERSLS